MELKPTYTSTIRHIYESKDKLKEYWKQDVRDSIDAFISDSWLDNVFDTRWKETMITYHNSVKNKRRVIGAMDFINEIYKEDKIIVENGVFFQNSRNVYAPTVESEVFLFKERKRVKKKGNYYLTEGNDPVLGAIYDNLQKNIKILMNTYYGVLTNPYSRFFNRDLGDSITCRGRSSISVSGLSIEGAFSKRIPKRIDALFSYWKECVRKDISPDILKEMVDMKFTADDVIQEFNLQDHYALPALQRRLSLYSPTDIAKIIFTNNFKLVSKLPTFKHTVFELFKACEIKQIPYLDPNELPFKKDENDKRIVLEEAKDLLDKIKQITKEVLVGMYWYGGDYLQDKKMIVTNTQQTISNIDRKTIPVIDTDSNFLSYETEFMMIYDIIKEENDNSFELKHHEEDNTFYTISNICATIMMEVIDVALDRYKSHVNIMPEKFDCLKLKNEFLFTKVLITSRKKNYLTVVALKEGKPYPERKLDVKGLPFMKSSVNSNIGDATKGVVNQIMSSEKLALADILQKIRYNTHTILEQHKNQNLLNYCVALKVKTKLEETDKSDYRYKMVTLWNAVCDSGDKIETPASFYSIPISLTEEFKTNYPDIYNKMLIWLDNRNVEMIKLQVKSILEDKENSKYPFIHYLATMYGVAGINTTQDWIDLRKQVMEDIKKSEEKIKSVDLNYMVEDDIDKIAFPVSLEAVPEWIFTCVNSTTSKVIINNLIAPIVQELHLVCPRNSEDKRMVTNILDVY